MSCVCEAIQEEKYMKVKQLFEELTKLMTSGHANDDIVMAQKYDNGYVYQNVFSVAEYDEDMAIGLIGHGIIDDRRS